MGVEFRGRSGGKSIGLKAMGGAGGTISAFPGSRRRRRRRWRAVCRWTAWCPWPGRAWAGPGGPGMAGWL